MMMVMVDVRATPMVDNKFHTDVDINSQYQPPRYPTATPGTSLAGVVLPSGGRWNVVRDTGTEHHLVICSGQYMLLALF